MSPRHVRLTEEVAGRAWSVDEFGNLWQNEVPPGCVRVSCANHHSGVIPATTLNKACMACGLPQREVSQATWDRARARIRRNCVAGRRVHDEAVPVTPPLCLEALLEAIA